MAEDTRAVPKVKNFNFVQGHQNGPSGDYSNLNISTVNCFNSAENVRPCSSMFHPPPKPQLQSVGSSRRHNFDPNFEEKLRSPKPSYQKSHSPVKQKESSSNSNSSTLSLHIAAYENSVAENGVGDKNVVAEIEKPPAAPELIIPRRPASSNEIEIEVQKFMLSRKPFAVSQGSYFHRKPPILVGTLKLNNLHFRAGNVFTCECDELICNCYWKRHHIQISTKFCVSKCLEIAAKDVGVSEVISQLIINCPQSIYIRQQTLTLESLKKLAEFSTTVIFDEVTVLSGNEDDATLETIVEVLKHTKNLTIDFGLHYSSLNVESSSMQKFARELSRIDHILMLNVPRQFELQEFFEAIKMCKSKSLMELRFIDAFNKHVIQSVNDEILKAESFDYCPFIAIYYGQNIDERNLLKQKVLNNYISKAS